MRHCEQDLKAQGVIFMSFDRLLLVPVAHKMHKGRDHNLNKVRLLALSSLPKSGPNSCANLKPAKAFLLQTLQHLWQFKLNNVHLFLKQDDKFQARVMQ